MAANARSVSQTTSPNLAYQFTVGEIRRHRQTNSLLLEDPDAGPVVSRVVYDLESKVAAELPGGQGWEIQETRRLVKAEGPLVQNLQAGPREVRYRYAIGRDGSTSSLEGEAPNRTPMFPAGPVAVGDNWEAPETVKRATIPPMATIYRVSALEERGADLVAEIVGAAQGAENLEGQDVGFKVDSSATFSVTHGRLLHSVYTVEMQFPPTRPGVQRRSQTSIEIVPA